MLRSGRKATVSPLVESSTKDQDISIRSVVSFGRFEKNYQRVTPRSALAVAMAEQSSVITPMMSDNVDSSRKAHLREQSVGTLATATTVSTSGSSGTPTGDQSVTSFAETPKALGRGEAVHQRTVESGRPLQHKADTTRPLDATQQTIFPRHSSLSLQDMFMDKHDEDIHENPNGVLEEFTGGENPNTEEVFAMSSDQSHANETAKGSFATPPGSLSVPPQDTACVSPLYVGQPASTGEMISPATNSFISQGTVASSVTSDAASLAESSGARRTVLYSAIGSLEDPSAVHSFSRRYHSSNARRKFEFPSTRGTLLPPPNRVLQSKGATVTSNATTFGTSRSDETMSKTEVTTAPSEASAIDQSGRQNFAQTTESASAEEPKKPSNLRNKQVGSTEANELKQAKKVTIADDRPRRPKKKKGPTEMFRPSSDAYTPRMGKKVIKYKPAEMRTPVQKMASPLGTLSRPNFRDALRRVAMILRQHIVKIEHRFENKRILHDDKLFRESMKDMFSEESFSTPTYRCTIVRVPMARPGMVYGLRRIKPKYEIPSEGEIYEFAHRLFNSVQLSSECSIVCLIYVERLMETAKVPLLASTWRPIFMCGLLLASKVWQDLSSWNIEFAGVYPQFSLDSINRLEVLFLRMIKWDLYISSSAYAKYYFALRSLVEKPDFRQRYNRMVGGVDSVQASEALKIEKRSSMVKEEALSQLSRSM